MNFPILIYKGVYLTVGSFFSNKKYITIYNIIKEKKINRNNIYIYRYYKTSEKRFYN